MHTPRLLLTPLLIAMLTACGSDKPAGAGADAQEAALPAPPGAPGGSVTGMPTPAASTPDPGLAALATAPPPADATPASPDPVQDLAADTDAALAVLRDYYAAINARDFPRAHALWRQNPQTPAQFADGFAGTTGVSIEIGTPGPVDAGAGQRFIEIAVRLEASLANGQLERYAGRYVLHRSVVEGGNPTWRIERATLAKQ